MEKLFAPIEINLAILLVVGEVVIMLLTLTVFFYLRARKYKPYYEANTDLPTYVKRYLGKTIELTRAYARKITDAASGGEINAMKRRQNMVARLNWLVLERDFVLNKPDRGYWDDINFRITKLLKRWDEIQFIDNPPDEKMVVAALSENPAQVIREHATRPVDTESEATIKALKERAQYLEKQVRKLSSYKSLYQGIENSYEALRRSYKKLKNTVTGLELKAEDKEKLEKVLSEHEAIEQSMDSKLKEMEDAQKRLTAELTQLEAAFNKLEEERRLDLEKMAAGTLGTTTTDMGVTIKDQSGATDVIVPQQVFDNHDTMMREFRAAFHALNLDTDTKILLDEKMDDLEKANDEIKTCMGMIELERNRLKQEIEAIQSNAAT